MLGAVLKRLHGLPRLPSFELPDEDILGRVEYRVSVAPVSAEDKQFLMAVLHELRAKLGELVFPLAAAPTQGDAHSENIMIRDGERLS
jgi:hypothetical protein